MPKSKQKTNLVVISSDSEQDLDYSLRNDIDKEINCVSLSSDNNQETLNTSNVYCDSKPRVLSTRKEGKNYSEVVQQKKQRYTKSSAKSASAFDSYIDETTQQLGKQSRKKLNKLSNFRRSTKVAAEEDNSLYFKYGKGFFPQTDKLQDNICFSDKNKDSSCNINSFPSTCLSKDLKVDNVLLQNVGDIQLQYNNPGKKLSWSKESSLKDQNTLKFKPREESDKPIGEDEYALDTANSKERFYTQFLDQNMSR